MNLYLWTEYEGMEQKEIYDKHKDHILFQIKLSNHDVIIVETNSLLINCIMNNNYCSKCYILFHAEKLNINFIIKFMCALKREDYIRCREIIDEFKAVVYDNNTIEKLKQFVRSCQELISEDLCENTINMLNSLKR